MADLNKIQDEIYKAIKQMSEKPSLQNFSWQKKFVKTQSLKVKKRQE